MLQQGELVDGRYEVEAMVGEGGLAQVYRVRHKALGSVHALKLLSWRKKQLAERLLTEGRIQAQLAHPNIVAVIDLVQHDGQFGLLMEYVDNECLEDFIVENGGLGVQKGLELFAPILSAVAAAHEAGVTHRDLKPANILLAKTARGLVPKVTDFGIAKVMAELSESSTAIGSTMGTPGYLAPEQTLDSSKDIDARADVFALGAILYEVISGSMAFLESDGTVQLMSTSRVTPPPLTQWISDVPEHLDAVLAKAMQKDPDQRYASCVEFARDLFLGQPHLLAMVANVGGITTTLSLSGASEEISRSLDRRPTGPTPPTLLPEMALPSDEEEGPGARMWLGLGLMVAGAVVITVTLAGLGAFGVKMQLTSTPDEPIEPLPVLVPVPVPAVAPVVPPVEPAIDPVPPVEPEPEPQPPEPQPAVDPQPAQPAPEPSEAPVPSPVPEPPAVPAPAVEPAPQPDVAPEPVPAVVPEPPPAPEPVVAVVDPEPPPPKPVAPDLAGSWSGKANKRPFRLTLVQGEQGALSGRVVFPGATAREESVVGTIEPSGQIRFRAGDMSFQGRATTTTMVGTYEAGGGKPLEWAVSK